MNRIATTLMGIACVLPLLAAGTAQAENNQLNRIQNQLQSRRTGVDIRIIEQREQRLDFQAEQRRHRQEERRSIKPMKLKVPVTRPTCQLPIDGNAYAGARCR